MFLTRPPKVQGVAVIVLSVLALVSACGRTPEPPSASADPTNSTVPLGPQSTVTVEVASATPPPKITVATLSIAHGTLQFRDVRNGPAPVHERLPFSPPPGAEGMGVVVRFFGEKGDEDVDCTITVDGTVVDHEEHVNDCSYSNDPRWSYLLIKGVVPGRYYPPDS